MLAPCCINPASLHLPCSALEQAGRKSWLAALESAAHACPPPPTCVVRFKILVFRASARRLWLGVLTGCNCLSKAMLVRFGAALLPTSGPLCFAGCCWTRTVTGHEALAEVGKYPCCSASYGYLTSVTLPCPLCPQAHGLLTSRARPLRPAGRRQPMLRHPSLG